MSAKRMLAGFALVAGVALSTIPMSAAASASEMSDPTSSPAAAPADLASAEVAVSTYWSDSVHICGVNQYNRSVCSPQFNTPGTGFTLKPGWWWAKGHTVTIWGLDNTHHKGHKAYCSIPYGGETVVYCDGRTNRSL